MRIFILTVLLLFGVTLRMAAQGIRGEVQDINGEPVPYAAIFIKELTRGTTCNAIGQFALPLPAGEYNIFFRSLGYTEVNRNITVGEDYTELVIHLPPQTYMIPEVRISATGEDPAYWIMRKAIGLANYHLHEVSSYDAEIYIKGTAIIEEMPKAIARRIRANELEVKEDETYMLESLNEVHFTAPDKYQMRVIASQNTLPGYTDNVNPMDYINASLYQQQIEGVVSPLARNAFVYYRFSFEGTFMEGTRIVNKIKVTPKRKSQQLVEGYLYIVEDLWCLHSSDLSLNTIAGTIFLQQLYANVIMDAWLPVNHKIQANVEIVGVKGTATYVSSLKYSDVILNPNLPETYFTAMNGTGETGGNLPEEEQQVSREQEKINELLKKEELTNREVVKLSKLIEKEAEKADQGREGEELNQTGTTFSVAEDAVKNDSLYWNQMRPIPLTPEEQITLQVRDSIMGTGGPAPAKDSLQVVSGRKGRPFRNLVYGKTYTAGKGRFRFTYNGLLDPEMFGYNTVDGICYGQEFRVEWRPDSVRVVRSFLTAGYAFHRSAPLLSWTSDLLYAPMARGKVALNLDYTSSDFNGQTGIPSTTSMIYTLFLRQNYMKLYEKVDAILSNRIDLTNGLVLTTSATFGLQNRLDNRNYFSFFFRNAEEERFTPNTPGGRPRDAGELLDHRRLMASIELEYTPRQHYVIRNYRKELRGSDWPTFLLSYRKAFPLKDSGWSDFSVLETGIRHSFDVGLMSRLDWSVGLGYFPDTASVHFSDFKHFKTNPLYVDMAGLDQATMFADYYESSTSRYWVDLHATLTSSYLLVKYLPWFSERLWRESLHLGYTHTPSIPNYLQFGYSLNEIFFLVDLGVFVGFRERSGEGSQGWGYEGITGRLNFRF
jgi:hypothetical protein